MPGPIPDRLKDEFIGFMRDGYDDDDAPDGAWFQRMEDDAFAFMQANKLRGCENSAVHQLLDWLQPSPPANDRS